MTAKRFKLLHTVIFALGTVLALVLINALFKFANVPSESMLPTYEVGDIIVANKLAEPERGKPVLFYVSGTSGEMYVKRCIALGGDKLSMENGTVYVNGERLDEPYVYEDGSGGEGLLPNNIPEFTVPEGHMFVLGDNRNNSLDSRYYGTFPLESVVAVPLFSF